MYLDMELNEFMDLWIYLNLINNCYIFFYILSYFYNNVLVFSRYLFIIIIF